MPGQAAICNNSLTAVLVGKSAHSMEFTLNPIGPVHYVPTFDWAGMESSNWKVYDGTV